MNVQRQIIHDFKLNKAHDNSCAKIGQHLFKKRGLVTEITCLPCHVSYGSKNFLEMFFLN
jgi:hypothetical protein